MITQDSFRDYKIAFEKFLQSEGGEIYVQCKTFNEALYGLKNLMEMVSYEKYHELAYSISGKIYYWNYHKENTVFCLTADGSSYSHVRSIRMKGRKIFSYQGFNKRMKYFMYIDGKEGKEK